MMVTRVRKKGPSPEGKGCDFRRCDYVRKVRVTMRRLIVLLALSLLLAPAATAATKDPRVPALQRQVKTLKAQVQELQASVAGLTSAAQTDRAAQAKVNADNTAHFQYVTDLTTCYYALDHDTFGGFWNLLSLLAQNDGAAAFPPWPPYDDRGACTRVGIKRGGLMFAMPRL